MSSRPAAELIEREPCRRHKSPDGRAYVIYAGLGRDHRPYRPAGQVEHSILGAGTVARYVATGDVTNGQFGLFEWDMPNGAGGRNAHFHKTFSESFYVTSGTVSFFNGETWITATKGDFYYVPEGGIHAYHNDSGSQASMLVLFAPGAPRENYFRELATISAEGRHLSDGEWTELWARYDQYRA